MAAACNPSAEPVQPAEPRKAETNTSPVLVELYTSQGCSSCPPADALLRKLGADPRVVPLAFHVDYWDYLGWRDPHGSEAWSDRQRRYAASAGHSRIYTPQLLFNGLDESVGRRASAAEQAIASASAPSFELELEATLQQDAYEVRLAAHRLGKKPPQGLQVFLAAFESGISTKIRRGENAGRNLTHDFIVRDLRQICSVEGGPATNYELVIPAAKRRNTGFAAFVQDPKTMAVVGATRIEVAGQA